MAKEDFYKTLGVAKTASADEIKRAYRKLARKYHPDVHKGADADAKFKAAGDAYDVLRDPEKRAAYDQYGADWETGAAARPGPEWEGGYGFDRDDISGADAPAFRDFFESAFGQGAGARGYRSGFAPADQHAQISLDIEEAMQGVQKRVSLRMPVLDDHGAVTWKEQHLDVRIPKGVSAGQQIRLKGKGAQGGDLFLEIALRPHPIYRIEGKDISVDLPITPWEAALGARVPMPTPAGKVEVKVPPNARSGQRLRLKGRGMPGPAAGDMYAILQIVNPPMKTAEARAFYEKMAQELQFDPRAKLGV